MNVYSMTPCSVQKLLNRKDESCESLLSSTWSIYLLNLQHKQTVFLLEKFIEILPIIDQIWRNITERNSKNRATINKTEEYDIDVFGPLRATRGTHASGPRRRQTLAGERGRGRVTEDRGRGVGDQNFPALIITMRRGEGQEYSHSTSYPPPPPPPPPTPHGAAFYCRLFSSTVYIGFSRKINNSKQDFIFCCLNNV